MPINKKHVGESFEEFLKEEGLYHEVMEDVAKKRLALQFKRQMKKMKITKTQMAEMLQTSRAQINRILSPDATVTIDAVRNAAAVLRCRFKMDLEPIAAS